MKKWVALLQKLETIFSRPTLLTIYKASFRPHLDYGDTIYDKAYNDCFHQKLESIQYKAALAITRAIRATSSEKLYQELSLESLQQRRWYRKLYTFFKIIKEKSTDYLFNIIRKNNCIHRTRNFCNIPQFNIKHNFFKNSFFPSVIAECFKLDTDIGNLSSLSLFKSRILKFIWRNPKSIFNCHKPKAIKYLSRIRLGLSHLCEHKFNYSFQDVLNPICACGSDVEIPCHYFIYCPIFDAELNTLLNNIRQIAPSILHLNHSRSSLWCLFSKKWNKYWYFEQHYELCSLSKEVWRFYFKKDNMVFFETSQFSFFFI